jgi:hypothetical protein
MLARMQPTAAASLEFTTPFEAPEIEPLFDECRALKQGNPTLPAAARAQVHANHIRICTLMHIEDG